MAQKFILMMALGLLLGCAQTGGAYVANGGAQVVSTFHDEIEIFLPPGASRADADRLARLHCSGYSRQLSPPRNLGNGMLRYNCFDTSVQ